MLTLTSGEAGRPNDGDIQHHTSTLAEHQTSVCRATKVEVFSKGEEVATLAVPDYCPPEQVFHHWKIDNQYCSHSQETIQKNVERDRLTQVGVTTPLPLSGADSCLDLS